MHSQKMPWERKAESMTDTGISPSRGLITPPPRRACPFSQHPLWNSSSKSKPIASHLRGGRGFPRHFRSSHSLPARPIYKTQRGGRREGRGALLGAHPSVCTLSPICEGLPRTKSPRDGRVNFYGPSLLTAPLSPPFPCSYFLLFFSCCVCVCARAQVAQSHLTLCDPMDYTMLGSSVHGIIQARTLEWVAIPFSRRSS